MTKSLTYLNATKRLLRILFLLGVMGCSNLSYAQGWEVIFGSVNSNALEVITAHDGNFIVQGAGVNPDSGEFEKYLLKLDQNGDEIWRKNTQRFASSDEKIARSPDGNYIGMASVEVVIGSNTYGKTMIYKFDENGNTLWEHIVEENGDHRVVGANLFVDQAGIISLTVKFEFGSPDYLINMDSGGNLLLTKTLDAQIDFEAMLPSKNGGYLFTSMEVGSFLVIYETDSQGELINTFSFPNVGYALEYQVFQLDNEDWVVFRNSSGILTQTTIDAQTSALTLLTIYDQEASVIKHLALSDGYISALSHFDNSVEEVLLIRTDFAGNVIWQKIHNHRPGSQIPRSITSANDGGFVVAGVYADLAFTEYSYIFKIDSLGNIYSNSLTGTVAIDNDQDCLIDITEEAIEGWLITAEKPAVTFVASSNAQGEYVLPLDTGNYMITLHAPSNLWEPCVNEVELDIIGVNNQENLDFPIVVDIACPSLTLSQSIPSIRPCFERPGYINYCNYGTTVAENAYVEIAYDSLITLQSSSIPWVVLPDNVYRFNIGDIAPLECGNFRVGLFLDCDATVGASFCAEAHAYPDTICVVDSMGWNGAFLEANGSCDADKVNLRIENVGNGNMDDYASFIIIEDILLLKIDSLNLDVGMSVDTNLVANGSTFMIIAEQVPGAPGMSNPIAVVEGCGENGDGEFSVGFTNQFPLDDANPFLDIDCPIAISSFDPNDKQGFPIGYKDEHFIEPETPIEYLIRFQNTGTDTAFTVIVRDTLDENLSLASFRPGASSHPYGVELEGQGIVKFTFQNINLPDSIVDEPGSNGFVEFKIIPQETAPLGTVIRNKAGIYFDFNEPIITNETFHTLGIDFIEVKTGTTEHPTIPNINVSVHPNPFTEFAIINIENHSAKEYQMDVFDLQGKLRNSETCTQSTIVLRKKSLTSGMYIYRISAADGFLHTGKILVH